MQDLTMMNSALRCIMVVFFCGSGTNMTYLNEKINWFDHCESDSWSLLWIDDFIEELGHQKTVKTKLYWLLPGKEINDGLGDIAASKGKSVVLEDMSLDASFGDEGLDLPESSEDEDNNIKIKFKNFQPVDMESPQFSVGMIFGSVQEVHNAIKQYSIKNRVAINTPRTRIHCTYCGDVNHNKRGCKKRKADLNGEKLPAKRSRESPHGEEPDI
jgi:hypothetical protein